MNEYDLIVIGSGPGAMLPPSELHNWDLKLL